MMSGVFVDTAALVALASKSDQRHAQALRTHLELLDAGEQLFVSQWVLTECLGWSSVPSYRAAAARIVDPFLTSPAVTTIDANTTDWKRAFELYKSRPDKGWSLVDCASILACQERGITTVFSSDHHFTQAGLSILLPT